MRADSLHHAPCVPSDPPTGNRPPLDRVSYGRNGPRFDLRLLIRRHVVPQPFGYNMEVTTHGIRAARDTEPPALVTNRCPQRLNLIAWNTGDHRPGLGKNLRNHKAGNKRDSSVWSHTLKAVRDDAKTVPAAWRVYAGT